MRRDRQLFPQYVIEGSQTSSLQLKKERYSKDFGQTKPYIAKLPETLFLNKNITFRTIHCKTRGRKLFSHYFIKGLQTST